MMKFLPLFLFIPSLCFAGGYTTWTPAERNLWWSYTVLSVVDLLQTHEIASHPDRFYEKYGAWIMGEHPTHKEINGAFLINYGMNYFISSLMPDKWRTSYLIYCNIEKGFMIGNNYAIGIRINLK